MSFDNLIGYILSVSGPVSLFSEFEPRLIPKLMSFDNLIGYILSISMCMQNFITIFFTVQKIGPFSLFQNFELGKASTDKKCQFAISWARSCQYQWLRKSLLKYSTQFKRWGHFHFFRIWHSAKPRPMINVILQFLVLDLFNIKFSAKFYQNIPNGLRVKFLLFFFPEFELRQNLDQPNVIWQSHGLHLVNINVYAKFHHNIPLSSRDRAIFPFSEFGARQTSTHEKWYFTISWARSCQYQCLHRSLSKYSTQFKR